MSLVALIVDDSGIMRKMVISTLKQSKLEEFEFIEAEDGVNALAKFAENDIDIAFVDWNMPNMTGIEFVKQVRKLDEGGVPLPMVMVTSEKTMGKIQEALDEAGADAFIVKPFTVDDFVLRLKKIVEKAKLRHIRRFRDQREEQAEPARPAGFWGKMFN